MRDRNPASSIAKHLLRFNHNADNTHFKVVTTAKRPRLLTFIEALLITRHRPSLCAQQDLSVMLRLPWSMWSTHCNPYSPLLLCDNPLSICPFVHLFYLWHVLRLKRVFEMASSRNSCLLIFLFKITLIISNIACMANKTVAIEWKLSMKND